MKERNELLEVAWPDPLVSFEAIEATTPWIKPPNLHRLAFAPPRLTDIAMLVTTQENACRFCYGAQHTMMRLSGFSEEQIRDLERDAQLADGLTREVVTLARKLARSNPRPVRQELQALHRLGLDSRAAAEIVYLVAFTCYCNRLGTFLSLPPDRRFERTLEHPLRRMLYSISFRMSPMRTRRTGPAAAARTDGVLAPLVRALPESPAAAWFAGQLAACFSAQAIPRRTKLLMLAVIARTLGCPFCEEAARRDLEAGGLDWNGSSRVLDSLSGPGIGLEESTLLDWARETVHYETGPIQKRTRAVAASVGTAILLEAVGTAAISNTAVRLAMLLE